jgi:hypothetical protein
MNDATDYPIGIAGKKWGSAEKAEWLDKQNIKRSYAEEVLHKISDLKNQFVVEEYGSLPCNTVRYPLMVLKSRHWNERRDTVLVTGGVHGYETSGVQGAMRFLETRAADYSASFNIIVAPCVSPWGYETINRWNPNAIDPNRSFYADSPAEEAASLMRYLDSLGVQPAVHIDLHETTDTDNTEFRPALAARDAVKQTNWSIPDGFYLVGESAKPEPDFQTAIIKSVEQVTHIAPADEDGKLIGVMLEQGGVINYPARSIGLCMGLSEAKYVCTTEVYPDSPRVDAENCINAQVAAVVGGLEYVLRQRA